MTSTSLNRNGLLDDYVAVGILLSALLHLVPLYFIGRTVMMEADMPMVVDVIYEPRQNREAELRAMQQIVSPPDQSQPVETEREKKFLSDKDSSADRDVIHRGDSPDAGPVPGRVAPPQVKARAQLQQPPAPPRVEEKQPRTQSRNQPPGAPQQPLKELRLDRMTMMEKFGSDAPKRVDNPLSPQASKGDALNTEPFSRPYGSGAAILGMRGSNDYLPTLPDGDLTLLNAKADRFAVFVRRVATQVFSQIRAAGWENLRGDDVRSISDFATVRATLSLEGELLATSIDDFSGSKRFDEVINEAVEKGTRDNNPPKDAAAADGNIHFIFKAKSWSRYGSSRNGAPVERRWLVLATGLE